MTEHKVPNRNTLTELLPELADMLYQRLDTDYGRYGETWRQWPREGQEERIFLRFMEYWRQYLLNNEPIPWLKIIGLAWIAIVRELYPEELKETPREKRNPQVVPERKG